MFEAILAFMLTPVFVVSLAILAVIFDHSNHRGFASFLLCSIFAIVFFATELPLSAIAYAALAWIGAGVVYSWIRWVIQCKRAVRNYENEKIDKHEAMSQTYVQSNKGRITYWAFAWPISLTATLLSDVLSWLGKSLHFVFGNAYNYISDRSRTKIQDIAEKRNDTDL